MRVLGLKVRSGFGIGIIVGGRRATWKIERRLEVPLTAGNAHYARFPFHPLVDIGGAAGDAESQRYVSMVENAAKASLAALLPTIAPLAHAVIVAGSLIDPDRIANPHMQVHAREGELYRRLVREAFVQHGVANDSVVEKHVHALTAGALGIGEKELLAMLTAAGRGVVKPWRSDEKLAASAALWKLPV